MPDNGFATMVYEYAIMISGLAIMIYEYAIGIYVFSKRDIKKNKVKPTTTGFTPFHHLPFTRYRPVHRGFESRVKPVKANYTVLRLLYVSVLFED